MLTSEPGVVRDTSSEHGAETGHSTASLHSTPSHIFEPYRSSPSIPPAVQSSVLTATPSPVPGSPGYSLRMAEPRGSIGGGGGIGPSRRIAEFARFTTQKPPPEQTAGNEEAARRAPQIDRAFSERVSASASTEFRAMPTSPSFEETQSPTETSRNLVPSQVLRRSEVQPPAAACAQVRPAPAGGPPPALRPRPPKPSVTTPVAQAADATAERPTSTPEAANNRISGTSSASAPESAILASDKQNTPVSDSIAASESPFLVDGASRPAPRSKPPVPLPSVRIKK